MFRILHLSDLHIQEKSTWSTFPILRDAKKAILRQADKENIDVVAFTGDIAHSSKPAEYAIAGEWLDDLCFKPSGLNIIKDQVLFVPGNHDVDRNLITPPVTAIEQMLATAKAQANVAAYYDDKDSKALLLKRHKAYFDFCASFSGSPAGDNCWSRTFRHGEVRIRFDGLNTSWLCRGDDHKRLLVGQSQLTELLRFQSEADLCIAMMHHPLSDLMEFDEINTTEHLKRSADIVLRGHLHRPEVAEKLTNTGDFIEMAAGALHEGHEAFNRFSIIDITDDTVEMHLTTFIWQSGEWIQDRNLYRTHDGVGRVRLKKKVDRDTRDGTRRPGKSIFVGGVAQDGGEEDDAEPIANFPRFRHTPKTQDLAIRQKELEEAVARLRTDRKITIQKDAGSKYEGFISCIAAEYREPPIPVLYLACAGVSSGKQLQDAIEIAAGQSITLFGQALRGIGECVLILDDLDCVANGADGSPASVEETVEALHDFCPLLSIIRITALPPPSSVRVTRVGPLDSADTRIYLNKATPPAYLASTTDYARVHRVTGGVAVYLDDIIAALSVSDIEGALAQIDSQPATVTGSLHPSVVNEINAIVRSDAEDIKRTRRLLWTLAILEQGESLTTIRRLDARSPIWPKYATYLQSKGCLDAVVATPMLHGGHRLALPVEGEKILRIPRLVRDYVISIMSDEDRVDIIRSVATLYFAEDWRLGTVRMRRRLAVGTEISTHQSGNEMTILRHLLQNPHPFFGDSASPAFSLGLSYVSQLKSKGFYGEAYEAARDILGIVNSLPAEYGKEELHHLTLLAAAAARMVGDKEASLRYLTTAMPWVRESGVRDRLTAALVALALVNHSLKKTEDAKAIAKEIMGLASADSADYLQAKAILAEYEPERADAMRKLKAIAKKARNHGHHTVADNVTLEIVSEIDNTDEKLQLLGDIKSRRDYHFNYVRATLRRIETLLDAGRVSGLTDTDREDLRYSYQLAYSQRLSIFDWCHRVYWQYLTHTNKRSQLGELFMYSSFVWRLNGNARIELDYLQLLHEEHSRNALGSYLSGLIGYLMRRIAALTK